MTTDSKSVSKPGNNYAIFASLSSAATVALGAFGAHALKASVPVALLQTWSTAVQYQMFHSLALLVVATLFSKQQSRALNSCALLMVIGILLFSGSLYALVLSGIKVLGAITPLGGVAFIAAWCALAWHFISHRF